MAAPLISSCLTACERSGEDFIRCQAWNWALYSLDFAILSGRNGGACGLFLYTSYQVNKFMSFKSQHIVQFVTGSYMNEGKQCMVFGQDSAM